MAHLERVSATHSLYEYIDKAVDAVNRSVKRVGQMWEKQEARVREVVEGPPLPDISTRSLFSESTFVQHGFVSDEEEVEEVTPVSAARRQH